MEFESPADAWYVWIGVAIVSVGAAGIALGLPGEPQPDATEAAAAVDRVAASEYGASGSYVHDGDEVRLGTRQIGLRNDGGSSHASVAIGSLTPIGVADGELYEAGRALLAGRQPSEIVASFDRFDNESTLEADLAGIRREIDRAGATWQPASGELRFRAVEIDGETVVVIDG